MQAQLSRVGVPWKAPRCACCTAWPHLWLCSRLQISDQDELSTMASDQDSPTCRLS